MITNLIFSSQQILKNQEEISTEHIDSQSLVQDFDCDPILKSKVTQDILGKLDSNTCPDYTLYFPVIFGLIGTSCTDDVIQTGFNVDATNNMISVGYVSSATAVSCPLFTNNQIGKYPFISKLDQYGQILWIITMTTSLNREFQSPIIGGTYAYSYLVGTNLLRIVRLSVDTGTQDLEKNFDFVSTSTTTIKNAQLHQVSLELDIYSLIGRTINFKQYLATQFLLYQCDLVLKFCVKDIKIRWSYKIGTQMVQFCTDCKLRFSCNQQ
ncbi:UNKNOWN [Stylonychia lemnae]|uniref:Uncharacterized protein n=1 Tax=Stylonychia lemnae TaxID=5949 RepID=A0A077ZWK2_STYLE|nr:UNKNOWN [Stylonychia lemnae]|eukprot:CDW72836.1 UNKNOWN [Stylonychia lemnae]